MNGPRKPKRPDASRTRAPHARRSARFACADRPRALALAASLLTGATGLSDAHAQPAPAPGSDPPTASRIAATAPGFTLSLGGSTWDGDFGGPSGSNIAAVFVNARASLGDIRVYATLPWIRIRGRSTIFTGIDGAPLVVAPSIAMDDRVRDGLGDLTLGASWLAAKQDRLGVDVDVSARVKLPTAADSTHLSTGKTDVAVDVELSRSFGPVSPFARATYRFLGDPEGWNLKNGFAGSVGGSLALPRRIVLLLSYDFAERNSRFISDSHEIVGGFSAPLTPRIRLNGFGSAGLSSGAPDFGTGFSLSYGL